LIRFTAVNNEQVISTTDMKEDLNDHEGPPFLGTWRRVYLAVLFYSGCLIALLYLITRAFRI
jgi:hypothetical protein